MANLSLTQRCNRTCGYCFARDVMRLTDRGGAFMTVEDFEFTLQFLERSAVDEIKLLGGEPTLHPQFCRLVDLAHARGFRVLVLSGGLIPDQALRHLERADPDKIGVMLNVIPPGAFTTRERGRQIAVMSSLGSKVALGLNIDSPATPLDFLLELIDEHSLHRTVRLGLAHPIAGALSEYLQARHYPAVGRRVAAFFRCAREAAVEIEFDCGWVPCMFPAGFLEEFGITPEQVGLRCNPIVDLLPGRKAISCYPLATLASEPVTADHDENELAERLAQRVAPYRPMKLYKHCDTCEWHAQGECLGGCIAGAMTRLRAVS
jgi:hypothetical protein